MYIDSIILEESAICFFYVSAKSDSEVANITSQIATPSFTPIKHLKSISDAFDDIQLLTTTEDDQTPGLSSFTTNFTAICPTIHEEPQLTNLDESDFTTDSSLSGQNISTPLSVSNHSNDVISETPGRVGGDFIFDSFHKMSNVKHQHYWSSSSPITSSNNDIQLTNQKARHNTYALNSTQNTKLAEILSALLSPIVEEDENDDVFYYSTTPDRNEGSDREDLTSRVLRVRSSFHESDCVCASCWMYATRLCTRHTSETICEQSA